MSWGHWALWGFVGTIVLTTLAAASQGLGLTRMNIPYMLGTMFTPDRDRAKLIGFGVHLVNGWLFSLGYIAAFHALRAPPGGWARSSACCTRCSCSPSACAFCPGCIRAWPSEQHGPTVARQLEPPGFLALNYGVRTPIAVVLAHIVFGMILGGFYRVG